MRFSRVRFTLRRMMVAVAVVGVILACLVETQRRRERFLKIAEAHERQNPFSYGPGFYLVPATPTDEWHERMGQKYRRAASRPWEPVAPDPPEPKSVDRRERAVPAEETPALPALPDPFVPE